MSKKTKTTEPASPPIPEAHDLSKREWYAGLILQGLLANSTGKFTLEGAPEVAVKLADALLVQLEK